MSSEITRRTFLVGAGAGAAGLIGLRSARAEATVLTTASAFKLSVTRWPFHQFTIDQLSQMARELGLDSVELLEPDEWAIPKRHGLTCAMGYAPVPNPETRLTQGFNRVENHAWLIPAYERAIPLAAAAGVPSVICFSGSRAGQSDDEGRAVCARGLAPLIPIAERHGFRKSRSRSALPPR